MEFPNTNVECTLNPARSITRVSLSKNLTVTSLCQLAEDPDANASVELYRAKDPSIGKKFHRRMRTSPSRVRQRNSRNHLRATWYFFSTTATSCTADLHAGSGQDEHSEHQALLRATLEIAARTTTRRTSSLSWSSSPTGSTKCRTLPR